MLFILTLSEDTLVNRFVERNLTHLDRYMEYYDASASLVKGYLFPRFYLFYDDAHLLPVPYLRYQYLDTVHLRIEEREVDLGLPNVSRVGGGFAWSLLDPQVLALNLASREAIRYARQVIETSKRNAVINFRILIRTYGILGSILKALDSAVVAADSLKAVADTLRRLGRFSPSDYLELRMNLLKLKRLRDNAERMYAEVRDTISTLTGTDVKEVEIKGVLPDCLPYDSTRLIDAQRWMVRAEIFRFLPKVFAFGEVWYGRPVGLRRDSSGIGTVYGLRIALTFDETGRLKVRRENRLLRLLEGNGKGKRRNTERIRVDTTAVSEAAEIYEEALKTYRMGRLDAFALFKVRMEYYTLKVETLKERLETLRGRVCPVMFPEVPPQYTPSP